MWDPWLRWRAVLSPLAVAVWRELAQRQEDDSVSMDELVRVLRRRKTPIYAALVELEEHGFLSLAEREGA